MTKKKSIFRADLLASTCMFASGFYENHWLSSTAHKSMSALGIRNRFHHSSCVYGPTPGSLNTILSRVTYSGKRTTHAKTCGKNYEPEAGKGAGNWMEDREKNMGRPAGNCHSRSQSKESPNWGHSCSTQDISGPNSVKMGLLIIQVPKCPQTADGDTGTAWTPAWSPRQHLHPPEWGDSRQVHPVQNCISAPSPQALQCLFLSLVSLLTLCNTQRTSLGCLDNWNQEAQRLKQNQWTDAPFDAPNKSILIRVCHLLYPHTFLAPGQLSCVFVRSYLHHDPDLKTNKLCSTSPYFLYLYNQAVFPIIYF